MIQIVARKEQHVGGLRVIEGDGNTRFHDSGGQGLDRRSVRVIAVVFVPKRQNADVWRASEFLNRDVHKGAAFGDRRHKSLVFVERLLVHGQDVERGARATRADMRDRLERRDRRRLLERLIGEVLDFGLNYLDFRRQ